MSSADTLIVFLYSYFPAILLGLFFWWLDRFERESLLLVVLSFLWGSVGAILISFFWNTFFHILLLTSQNDSVASEMMSGVLVAPIVEELTKGVFLLVLLKLNKIDNVTDGILLAILVGLGFAATENVYYARAIIYPSSGELAMWYNLWFREIHTTLLHASSTALWGLLMGYSHYLKGAQRTFALANGFVLAIVTHSLWNFLGSFSREFASGSSLVNTAMRLEVFVLFALLLLLFLGSVKRESKVIVNELLNEVEQNIFPANHVEFFASLVRRPLLYQLPKSLAPKDYARLGVKLALRKNRYRFNPSDRLLGEIETLRARLRQANAPGPHTSEHNL